MKFGFLVLLWLSACAHHRSYPAHWWQPVPETERAVWEILPQAADQSKQEVILSKRNELGLLSNFAPTPFIYRGQHYASLEGFWQMMKYPEGKDDPRRAPGIVWRYTRKTVAQMTGFAAWEAGNLAEQNMRRLGIGWVSFEGAKMHFKTLPQDIERHYDLIYQATQAKVAQNPEVRRVLLSTRELQLRPDHFEDKDGTKSWKYYQILMEIRTELQKR